MNKNILGIKLSDGSFYPVLTAGSNASRQLELTTAKDSQTSIRLHLYLSETGTMEDAAYVDSLRIDNLSEHSKGSPTIIFLVSVDEDNNISAVLTDKETGISVSKTTSFNYEFTQIPDMPDFDPEADLISGADELSAPDIPDFPVSKAFSLDDLDDTDDGFQEEDPFASPVPASEPLSFDTDFDTGFDDDFLTDSPADESIPGPAAQDFASQDFTMEKSPFTDTALYDTLPSSSQDERKPFTIPLIICIVCAVISVAVLAIMLFMRRSVSQAPVLPQAETAVEAEPVLIPSLEQQEAAPATENVITVSSEPIVPAQPETVEPAGSSDKEQIRYLIKWGDTLWDLAGSYYRNPWAYPRIAAANNIKNPDLIISGTYITIPR